MKLLFVTSEVTPFAKTGGLADVCGALPAELAKRGHSVAIIMPLYQQVDKAGLELMNVKFDIPIGSKIVRGMLWEGRLPNNPQVPVYFVQQDDYFHRPELYRSKGTDYVDNCERFVFLCRAALESVRILHMDLDAVHCHDWQTGLIPAYLNIEYLHAPGYQTLASVFTIHNLAYQGQFWHWDMAVTGLDWRFFNWQQMEFYGKLNLLKTGIVFADGLTTVSDQYAREIQTPEHGCGLDGVLQQRGEMLRGIVNGVDYASWNPATDPHLAAKYSSSDWQSGKAANKAAMQRELGLPQAPETPVIGLIGRLADQKGWNLVTDLMQRWVRDVDVQWAILGTGEPQYEELLGNLARDYPHRVGVKLGFSDPVAHRIEAGADMFLMPSQYEPCGLNQLYSLKYGTVPVVRATGGLVDTVVDASPENLSRRTATGFSFGAFDIYDMERALQRALAMWWHHKDQWQQLVETGMKSDWSWGRSAEQYEQVYREAKERKRIAYERIKAAMS